MIHIHALTQTHTHTHTLTHTHTHTHTLTHTHTHTHTHMLSRLSSNQTNTVLANCRMLHIHSNMHNIQSIVCQPSQYHMNEPSQLLHCNSCPMLTFELSTSVLTHSEEDAWKEGGTVPCFVLRLHREEQCDGGLGISLPSNCTSSTPSSLFPSSAL